MKKYLFVLLLLFTSMPVIETGCVNPAAPSVAAVVTLEAIGQSAEQSVSLTASLYRDHLITDAEVNQVRDFYNNTFQPAFRTASAAATGNLNSIAPQDVISLASQLVQIVSKLQHKTP